MNLYCYLLLLTIFSFDVTAQEVIATTGEFGTNSEGSLSWTLGEIVTETVSNPDHHLTQGFQQVQEGYLSLSDESITNEFLIFPNPFSSEVNIVSNDYYSSSLLTIFDYQAKIVFQKNIVFSSACKQLSIDLSTLPAGFYYVGLITNSNTKQILQPLIKL